MRNLVLMDYANKKVETPIDLDDLNDIEEIEIRVITGDEIAIVLWKNGQTKAYDSSGCRFESFFDGSYQLYSCGEFIADLDAFESRKDSYEMFRTLGGYLND